MNLVCSKLRPERKLYALGIPLSITGCSLTMPWDSANSTIYLAFLGMKPNFSIILLVYLDVYFHLHYRNTATCNLSFLLLIFSFLQILRRCGGSVELVDVSNELSQLVRRPGLKKWKVSY